METTNKWTPKVGDEVTVTLTKKKSFNGAIKEILEQGIYDNILVRHDAPWGKTSGWYSREYLKPIVKFD